MKPKLVGKRMAALQNRACPRIVEAVPVSVQLRRILACLCIAALLFAVFAPANTGLLWAVLVPLALIALAEVCVSLYRNSDDPKAQPFGLLSLSLSRAPPVA